MPRRVTSTPALVARTRVDLARTWPRALAFHVLVQTAGLALVTPLGLWLARRLVRASGAPVITNFDLASFGLSLPGVAFTLLVAAVAFGFLFAEFAGLTWLAGHAIRGRPATLAATIAAVVRRLPALLALATRVFVRLLVLALPFVAVAGLLWWTTLREHDVNWYLAERPPEWRRAVALGGLLAAGWGALAAWQLARWLYAIPLVMLHGTPPWTARAESARLTRGHLWRLVLPLAAWWLALAGLGVAVAWLASFVTDAAFDWAGMDVNRVLPLVALFALGTLAGGLALGALQFAGHQFLVTRMYAERVDGALRAAPAAELPEAQARRVAAPVVAVAAGLVAVALGVAWYVASQLDLERPVAGTAHRGASLVAPENTLAAFRAAVAAGATYAELDVQRTRDGRLVVLHDADLMRMGGDARRVAASTLAELQAVDVGRRHGAAFAGERVPALEDVIALVRGRMKLNVELKYNVKDPGLAPAVVDLLRREDFLDQAVVTSLDYAALRHVKHLEPRLRTGHIVTAAVGDVTRTEADFLSLNAARATPQLIRRARRAGKEVHVWTVNDPDAMLRMVERGVDGVITDDPATFARVLAQRAALSDAEQVGLRLRVLFDRPPREVVEPAAVEMQ